MRAKVVIECVCVGCNAIYFATQKQVTRGKKYCTHSCSLKAPRVVKNVLICPQCEQVFRGRIRAGAKTRYCSPLCRKRHKEIERSCLSCNKVFYNRDVPRRNYCSRFCWLTSVATSPNCRCKQCDVAFYKTKSCMERTTLHFCSKICQHTYFVDDRSPLWHGHRKANRGHNWLKIRKQVIYFDTCCVVCRSPDTLHVDHIVPYGYLVDIQKNSKEEANTYLNLMVLCRTCHRRKTGYEYWLYRGQIEKFITKIVMLVPDVVKERVNTAFAFFGIVSEYERIECNGTEDFGSGEG